MAKDEKPQSSVPAQVVKDDPASKSVTERFIMVGELALAEPNVRLAATPFDDLDNVPPGGLPGDDIGDGEARPRTRKPRAKSQTLPNFTPPHNPQVVTGDDLNGLLLIMLLEMQEYWGGTIRSEVALYLAQQLPKRSGDRFHGMNTTSMAGKIREFVERKKWLAAETRCYTLTDRGRTIARLCQRKQSGKSSGGVNIVVRDQPEQGVEK